MNVQCALCDKIEDIDENSTIAKRLRNRGNSSYLCQPCYDRITERTKERQDTGKFRLHNSSTSNND